MLAFSMVLDGTSASFAYGTKHGAQHAGDARTKLHQTALGSLIAVVTGIGSFDGEGQINAGLMAEVVNKTARIVPVTIKYEVVPEGESFCVGAGFSLKYPTEDFTERRIIFRSTQHVTVVVLVTTMSGCVQI